MVIELKNVTREYKSGSRSDLAVVKALDKVSLTVASGEWLAIMGPSGSGKSSLLNLIGCLDKPTAGEIWIDDKNLVPMTRGEINRIRSEKIGFIFQQFHLIPYLTALENVMLAQYFHSTTDSQEALDALQRVGLQDRAEHLPSELSGGEQQRVCVARALINDPAIILADEPTGNLDAVNEEIVLRYLSELHQQGRTIVMVTHDPVVARLADRRIELHHGHVTEQETFAMADEEQIEEVLEELWGMMENGMHASLGAMQASGALPLSVAVEKMVALDLIVVKSPGEPLETPLPASIVDRCHEFLWLGSQPAANGDRVIELTARGRQRASNIVRRHRLAERLFMQTLRLEDPAQVEQQACKFEHILSPEATDSICTFLGHPRTCPHGSPIPPGPCCQVD